MYGTSVLKTLEYWPTLPIVVIFPRAPALDPPATEDEENIVAALKQYNRVISINIAVTSSLLEKFSAIGGPYTKLEDLDLLSGDGTQLTLPSTFRWSPRIRSLHLTRVASPALTRLLYSSTNVVDLQLHEVLNTCHISPATLANALARMAQLQSLSLQFPATNNIGVPLPSGERITLPVLTRLHLQGIDAYSEGLVARIDAPCLKDIEITFFDKHISDTPKIREFIDRIEIQKSHRRADILSSERAISISLTRPGVPTCIKFQVLCKTFRSQPFFMARICGYFSAFLLRVEDLCISTARLSTVQHGGNRGQWLGIMRRFGGAKWFHVSGDHSIDVVRALQLSDKQREPVLPSLFKLCVREPEPHYESLQEAILPFMHSCWLSGRFIVAEYERRRFNGIEPFSHKATIEMLSDDILLNIFLRFLDGSAHFWPTLVHVSQRWRRIVFTLPLHLDLRPHHTYGTPFLKALESCAVLPIVVNFEGPPALGAPSPEDWDNLVATLKQSGRVVSICLTVTSSLLGKSSSTGGQFSKLDVPVLLSQDDMQLTLPGTFRWDPRLRGLHLTRIAFPSLTRLIYSLKNLVDLQLHEVLDTRHNSPATLVNVLSQMAQLQYLSLYFLFSANHIVSTLPSRDRIFLPVLTHLMLRGIDSHSEGLVAKIDAPCLKDIEVTCFDKHISGVPTLREFIGRTETQKSHCRADILSSERSISISLTQPGASSCLKLQVLCKTFRSQPFFMAQICDHFSTFILRVEDLRITTARPSIFQYECNHGQWLELLRQFRGVKWFHVSGNCSTSVVRALEISDERGVPVLPALHKICLREPEPRYAPSREAAVSFMRSCRLSGRFIAVAYEQLWINELCGTGSFSHEATIETLSDDIHLNIFLHLLGGYSSSKFWTTLVHVSRRWRQILFASPLGRVLRSHHTYGMHISKTQAHWPTLPITVNFGGSPALHPPALEDEDNIVASLKQPSRISSISLTVTSSLLEKFSEIKWPFSKLEDLVLLSRDNNQLTLPRHFQWGPRLRRLHLTGIVFPALLQRISYSRVLVDVQLHFLEISHTMGGLSPGALANTLSRTPRLQSLSLHLPSTAFAIPPSSGERVLLPALTRLNLRGFTGYLEGLAARIDAPNLKDIEITFFEKSIFDAPRLCEFIDRIEMQKSHRLNRAEILSSERSISISLTQPESPSCLKLHVLCKTLHLQPFYMAQICTHFSAFLLRVAHLRISTTRPSSRWGDRNREQWLGIIRKFEGVKWFQAADGHSTDVVRALKLSAERCEPVLPALHKLWLREPELRHAPLREAVVSFMHTCWRSGRFIAVAFESGTSSNNGPLGTGPISDQATIEILSDDILLDIFLHFLDGSSQFWPTLAHVSQRWRQIIFASPLGLDLRLHCTYGTPVSKVLDCWPPFPIVVNYGGTLMLDPPAPEDENNIMAALNQSDRVSSISLTVTSSLLEKFSTISEPLSELETLILLSRDNMQLSLPSAFRWGPLLRSLHATRIAIPSLPQRLLPSQEVVDLQLNEIPLAGYFSPEVFADALSGMTQLRNLSLYFISLPPRRNYLRMPPPPGERTILPALTHLKYRGTSKYLDSFVARIDAPSLGDIDLTLFSQPTMDAFQLGRFIDRIEVLKPNSRANISIFKRAISICFTRPGSPTRLELRVSCEHLDWQLSSMAQICGKFFLSSVEDLDIETTKPPTGQDDMDSAQWPELIRSFGGAKYLRVTGELATAILHALGQSQGERTAMLPSLRDLCVPELRTAYGRLWEAVSSFISSRWSPDSSAHVSQPSPIFPVVCRNEVMLGIRQQYFCGICSSSFAAQQGLSLHNSYNHMPWIVKTGGGTGIGLEGRLKEKF